MDRPCWITWPLVNGIPTPRTILGYDIGAPRELDYYADRLKFLPPLAPHSRGSGSRTTASRTGTGGWWWCGCRRKRT